MSPAAYQLDLPDALMIRNVSLLQPYDSDGAVQPPPPILIAGQDEYEVDRITE